MPNSQLDEAVRQRKLSGIVTTTVVALALCFMLTSALTGWALYARFEQTNTNRAQIEEVWHSVVCSIERQVIKSPTVSQKNKKLEVKFYDGLLVHNVHAKPCGLVVTPAKEKK